MSRPFPTSFPLIVYPETLLKDITTRPLLPRALPTENERLPENIHPEYISPYLSLLPQEQMNIDLAKRDDEYRPADNHHMHNDTGDRMLYLATHLDTPVPRHRHWALQWRLEPKKIFASTNPALRVLETATSTNNYEAPFLINIGPRTTSATPSGRQAVFPITVLTLEQRQELEQIAWNVGVVRPDGEFNCQNWAAAVLGVAIARGILEEDLVMRTLSEALKDEPSGLSSSIFRPVMKILTLRILFSILP
ncbi:hypothetical protein H0H81_010581 [Sphagnurus paluster]|uniref:Uncharacterized protein n=1 Tax=Sphagnurus paluster TaxID=117069 RepID=A0A9P7GQ11_9AGAR|nr:hypothetical protein H0H81_010581 [Sphagnurus paluster]